MADTKISAFTGQDLASTSEFPFADSGSNFKASMTRMTNGIVKGTRVGNATNDYQLPYGFKFVTGSSAGSPTVNRLFGFPFYVAEKVTYTRIGTQVTTLHASGLIRMGIYNHSVEKPGALLSDLGTVTQASTGEKEITISLALDIGWYWLAWVCDVTSGMRIWASGNYSGPNINGVAGLSSSDERQFCYGSHTFGALPDPFPAVTWATTSTTAPVIWMRKV